MGRLTDDMTRLCNEIEALHSTRESFIHDLTHSVTEMQDNFRNARTEMAEKTRAERLAFVSELKETMAEMQNNFRNAHDEMARELRAELASLRSDLEKTVSGMRQEFAEDIQGARQAWFGKNA